MRKIIFNVKIVPFKIYGILCLSIFITKLFSIDKIYNYNISDIREAFMYIVSAFSFYYIQRFIDLERVKKEYEFWTSLNRTSLFLNARVKIDQFGVGYIDNDEFFRTERLIKKTLDEGDVIADNFKTIKEKLVENNQNDKELNSIINGGGKIKRTINWYLKNL